MGRGGQCGGGSYGVWKFGKFFGYSDINMLWQIIPLGIKCNFSFL